MIMYDQDPDIVRWGLHLLHCDPFSTTGYCEIPSQNVTNLCTEELGRESNIGTDYNAVENDEIIAHALQEELAQVAVVEASGVPLAGDEHVQASVLAQDWLGPSARYISPGPSGVPLVDDEHVQASVLERDWLGPSTQYRSPGTEGSCEANDIEPSSSCSSPGRKSYEGELQSIELTDSLDGEVGKRLNQMVPVPHVPRINGEIPSVDEATSDHQRLLDRLQLYDVVELKIQGDGNCQFRALSDQFYRTPEHHKFVRQQVLEQLKSHPEIYEGYVPMAYDEYLKNMSKNGEWGDHVTLQAAADSYGVKIFIITSFKNTCCIEILPAVQKSKRVIFLSFWAEVHYNSIYPEGELPTESRKKKRWWQFANA